MNAKFLIIYLFLNLTLVNAQDLGIKNTVFNLDNDARLQIKNTVRKKYANGEIHKFWKQYAEQSVSQIKYPAPLLGITTNSFVRTEFVEMKYLVQRDYVDIDGLIIVRKGTVIEPLKLNKLKYGLLFIDGRDTKQVNYALDQIKLQPLKIILIAGSPYELRLKYQGFNWMGSSVVPFYFDQRKMIINQLARLYSIHINTVPVKLTQQGGLMQLNWGLPI